MKAISADPVPQDLACVPTLQKAAIVKVTEAGLNKRVCPVFATG
jgi:hypothetical protein